MNTVAIIGAGAYGTALADVASRAGREVALCARTPAAAEVMQATRNNPRLPGIAIDSAVSVVGDLSVVAGADIVLLTVPSQDLREALQSIVSHLREGTPVVACAKGIERGTHCFMTQIIAQTAPRAMPAILSGPNFAEDVARGLPTAVTLACADEATAIALVNALGSSTFRPYHSTDVRGVEIGGAAKNVLAIAVGIAAGRDLGASAQAALTTRGFSEIVQLGLACGARTETLAGLSGLGDLILTCASIQSRNFALGYALGRGIAPDAGKLAEGVATAPVLLDLAYNKGVAMPVAAAVDAVLGGEASVDQAIDALLMRPVSRGGVMKYWLVKSEPSVWSWDQQVAKGAKGEPNSEPWTGVRNYAARIHLNAMKKGDRAFFYHSNEGKEIVGIVTVAKTAYPDPTDKTGKFVCVDIAADKPLKKPVTLETIKSSPKLAGMALLKQSRLSVQPVTADEWKIICKMGGV